MQSRLAENKAIYEKTQLDSAASKHEIELLRNRAFSLSAEKELLQAAFEKKSRDAAVFQLRNCVAL
mgnify:CR=1 FL=1